MILTLTPLPSPLLPEPEEVVLEASSAQAVSEVRASRAAVARAAYLAVLGVRMVHVLLEVVRGAVRGDGRGP